MFIAPRALALLALRVLFGEVLLDGGRGDAAGEPVQRLGAGQLVRLVDALSVGVREAAGVGEPLRDEQTQDDGERGLGRPGAVERVEGLGAAGSAAMAPRG